MERSMIYLMVATALLLGGTSDLVSAQAASTLDLNPDFGSLSVDLEREQLRLEYESIRVGPPAGGLVVSTVGFLGGFALFLAGAFHDFCFCDEPTSRTAKRMMAGGVLISFTGFGGLVASSVFLRRKARRRREIRARLRDGAVVW